MDGAGAGQVRRSRRRSLGQLVRRLVAAIRDNDEDKVEAAVLQLARTRRIFAPLALLSARSSCCSTACACWSRTGG